MDPLIIISNVMVCVLLVPGAGFVLWQIFEQDEK